MNDRKPNKRRHLPRGIPAAAALLLALLLLALWLGRTVAVRSDSPGVTLVTDGGLVTEVKVTGPFPYGYVLPNGAETTTRDDAGRVTEKAYTQTVLAKFAWNLQLSAKIEIEASADIPCTYLFKFADRDLVILNGKVVASAK